MILLRVEAPYGTFRKSFARSYAETYPLPPPATVYGMLLSLVGERFRVRHEGVRLAMAFASVPRVATTLRKLSRFKYGVPKKQHELGNTLDFIQSLCGIDFLCWVSSEMEREPGPTLEKRLAQAVCSPAAVERYGVLSLGLSDDMVDVSEARAPGGRWWTLNPDSTANLELPVWVSHVGAIGTRFQRYRLDEVNQLNRFPERGSWTLMAQQTPG